MKRLYLFTLEIVPLEVGVTYDALPSHLTLMSRFLSDAPANELAAKVRPLFARIAPVQLIFGDTITLGPKKVTAHMVSSSDESLLHNDLRELLDVLKVEYQYPEFIGDNHRPHVTARPGKQFKPGSMHIVQAAYLIGVVDQKRVVEAKFGLKEA